MIKASNYAWRASWREISGRGKSHLVGLEAPRGAAITVVQLTLWSWLQGVHARVFIASAAKWLFLVEKLTPFLYARRGSRFSGASRKLFALRMTRTNVTSHGFFWKSFHVILVVFNISVFILISKKLIIKSTITHNWPETHTFRKLIIRERSLDEKLFHADKTIIYVTNEIMKYKYIWL